MAVSRRSLRVLSRRPLSGSVVELGFTAPLDEPILWKPGQFLTIHGEVGDGRTINRAYSILAGRSGGIRLWVEVHSSGVVGPWLAARQVGDEVEVGGPHGGFGLVPEPIRAQRALFVGEVTGIVPLLSMVCAHHFAPNQVARLLLLVPSAAFDLEEATRRELDGRLNSDSCTFTASPSVTALPDLLNSEPILPPPLAGPPGPDLYLAGSGSLLAAAWDLATKRGISPARIRQEKFW